MKFQLGLSAFTFLSISSTVFGGAAPRRRDYEGSDPHDMVDWSQHQFQAATETDARSPCPGLNTLANHGFLPRNGNNITIPMIVKSVREGFNVQRDMVLLAAKAALLTSEHDDQFSLGDIGLHGNIEHDASVSRQDRNLGDNIAFNEEIYTTLANSNPGVDYYNATSAGLVQKARLEQTKATNPNFQSTIKEFQIRVRESGLYLMVMSGETFGVAPKKFVDVFFREERMPIEEGWKISKVPIDSANEVEIATEIAIRSEFKAEEEQCPWVTLFQGGSENPRADGTI
ncbi:hypothetical protein PM082_007268 [Marasmius tenuissimus]|nr:hypothetical protein PM082_007268 [Marasmius tenuissimus]